MPSKLTTKEFIKKAKNKIGSNYDFSKTVYTKGTEKVIIGCPTHGDFQQRAGGHINEGYGCDKCSKTPMDTVEYLRRAKFHHGDRFVYDKTEYTGYNCSVIIKCKEHGYFKTNANEHLRSKHSCAECNSTMGEKEVLKVLKKYNLPYVLQYKFKNTPYEYDFYLPSMDILIEYDGEQHYHPIKLWGGDEYLIKVKDNDAKKTTLASVNNKPLIRIPYTQFENIEECLKKELMFLIKYQVNDKYYKTFLDICKGESLSPNTTFNDVCKYKFKM